MQTIINLVNRYPVGQSTVVAFIAHLAALVGQLLPHRTNWYYIAVLGYSFIVSCAIPLYLIKRNQPGAAAWVQITHMSVITLVFVAQNIFYSNDFEGAYYVMMALILPIGFAGYAFSSSHLAEVATVNIVIVLLFFIAEKDSPFHLVGDGTAKAAAPILALTLLSLIGYLLIRLREDKDRLANYYKSQLELERMRSAQRVVVGGVRQASEVVEEKLLGMAGHKASDSATSLIVGSVRFLPEDVNFRSKRPLLMLLQARGSVYRVRVRPVDLPPGTARGDVVAAFSVMRTMWDEVCESDHVTHHATRVMVADSDLEVYAAYRHFLQELSQ